SLFPYTTLFRSGSFFGQNSSLAPFCSGARQRDSPSAKIDVTDAGNRSGLGQQTSFCHSRYVVDLQNERLAALGQNDVHSPVHLQASCKKCAERKLWNFLC